jgi:hypothetical protein
VNIALCRPTAHYKNDKFFLRLERQVAVSVLHLPSSDLTAGCCLRRLACSLPLVPPDLAVGHQCTYPHVAPRPSPHRLSPVCPVWSPRAPPSPPAQSRRLSTIYTRTPFAKLSLLEPPDDTGVFGHPIVLAISTLKEAKCTPEVFEEMHL